MATHVINAKPGSYQWTGTTAQLMTGLQLDPGGPFYKMVLVYLVASASLTPAYDSEHYPDFLKDVSGVFPGKLAPHVLVDLRRSINLARDGTLPQRDAEIGLCCMLANATYESISDADRERLRGDPVFEVFRHVRNAASHGNAWHFDGGRDEPRRRGEWRGLVIDDTLKGDANPLQGQQCVYGTLQPADLLALLADVEKALVT